MKKKFIFTLFITSLLVFNAFADELFKTTYNFKNVSANYLSWSKRTKEQTPQADFFYLELEMGTGFDWGDFYMFVDIENPTHSYKETPSDDQRYVLKPVLDVKLLHNFYLHIQDYNLQSKTFYVSNFVLGLSYKLHTDFGFWIQAFIGPHYQKSTYYSGKNGYMTGWVLNYDFTLLNQNLTLTQWHEMTFKRDIKDGYNHNGVQGAMAIWWHPRRNITPGIQYRYASYQLGQNSYQNAIIYSLKYYF